MEADLRRADQVVMVVIATDGESTDGDMAKAMEPLTELPVNVVIRLCTDDPELREYWNNIDKQLGESILVVQYLVESMNS